jgi:hypothetical protein
MDFGVQGEHFLSTISTSESIVKIKSIVKNKEIVVSFNFV